ncbi:MAG: 2-amino-4-hydroxy-6-hydroxymethyldihydropteridine diphosphokinase [Polyangiales bacterium]
MANGVDERAPKRVVIGLGSNLGDRAENLRRAVRSLGAIDGVRVLRASPIYETEPLGPPQGRFLNAAVLVESALDLRALLGCALEVERLLGRERRERWGPRVIDLDLLWCDGDTLDEPGLSVPHPELTRRDFALLPALDVLDAAPAVLLEARMRLRSELSPAETGDWTGLGV